MGVKSGGFFCCPSWNLSLANTSNSNYNVITMKLKIIDIGNSKGVRLPKGILQQLGIENEVSLETSKDALILKATHSSRFEWAKAFHEMAKNGDDKLLDGYTPSSWDDEEWEWK